MYLGQALQGFSAIKSQKQNFVNQKDTFVNITHWRTNYTGGFTSGAFQAASGIFTAPSTGYYYFTSNIRLDQANGQYHRIWLAVDDTPDSNNELLSIEGNPYLNYYTMNVGGTMFLKKGQKVNVQSYSNDDTNYAIVQGGTTFSGYYLGTTLRGGFRGVVNKAKMYTKTGSHQLTGWDTPYGTGFNKSTGNFIAPTDGYYRFSAQIRFTDLSSTYARLFLIINDSVDLKNGAHTIRGQTSHPKFFTMFLSANVFLKKGDKVALWFYNHDDKSFSVDVDSSFTGALVRPMRHSGFHVDLNKSLRMLNKKGQVLSLTDWRSNFTGGYNTGEFNLKTGIFTASRSGYYNVNAKARFDGEGGNYSRLFVTVNKTADFRNGLHSIEGHPKPSSYYSQHVNGVLYLNKGDTLTLQCFSDSDSDYTIESQSGFSVYYIGAGLSAGFSMTIKTATRVQKTSYTKVDKWQPANRAGFSIHHSQGNFNEGSGEYTVPLTGYYYVTAQLRIDQMQLNKGVNYARLLATINGKANPAAGLHAIKSDINAPYTTLSIAGTLLLTKGQKLGLQVYSHIDKDYTIQIESGFSAYLVSTALTAGFQVNASKSKVFKKGWSTLSEWKINAPGGFNTNTTHLDVTKGLFTAPVSGFYHFSSNSRLDAANGDSKDPKTSYFIYHLKIGKSQDLNNGMSAIDAKLASPYYTMNLAGNVFLTKGETVQFAVYANNDTSWSLQVESSYSAHFIAAADADGDGVPFYAGDCNDNDKTIFPAYAGKQAAPELCDGKDNDCNGKTDDGYKPVACKVIGLKGACANGTTSCAKGQLTCTSQIKPAAETCNGKDDDCDGQIDESFPEDGKACKVPGAQGECANSKTTCTSGKLSCPKIINPEAEKCDGKDNNCDGKVDETCSCKPGETRACYTGSSGCTEANGKYTCRGICKTGTQTCSGSGQWGSCSGEVKATSEVCDGKDNNCDGKIDESVPEDGKACKVANLKGACANGRSSCTNGKVVCKPTVKPEKETCDGRDNNCDGKIDEAFPEQGKDCKVPGQQGECANGKYTCSTGQLKCPQTVKVQQETCNGKDDNCDGKVDEQASASCGAGQVCAGGKCTVLPDENSPTRDAGPIDATTVEKPNAEKPVDNPPVADKVNPPSVGCAVQTHSPSENIGFLLMGLVILFAFSRTRHRL